MVESYAVDATVLIDLLRGVADAQAYLAPLLNRRCLILHPAVQAEVLSGARDRRHLTSLDTALASFRICTLKNADMTAAIALVRAHTLSHGIGWPDCLIAATCLRLDLPLVTLNDKHFKPVRGLTVVRPY